VADKKPRVLMVDDEVSFAEDIAALVSDHLRCDVVGTPTAAMQAIRKRSYDIAFLDIDLHAEEDGIALLKKLKAFDPTLPVIMLTKSAELASIVESIKAGAFYYVIKGTGPSIHELAHIANLAIEEARMRRAVAQIDEDAGNPLDAMVGKSPAIERVKREVRRVAPLECFVFITGESGTGKELVARAIHALSGRSRKGRFVAVNCAALPEQLVESELFGHEKGAFTGAEARRLGKFEHANGGTLLLDEVGDMPLGAQAKVLRVLQEKELERVGGNQIIETDARVVSATNHDIPDQIAGGTFREDLFYRINEYTIHIPPLRERPEDVPEIALHLARTLGREMGRGEMGVSRGALEALSDRDWRKNNVRELRNTIIGAIIRCGGDTVQTEDLGYEGLESFDEQPRYRDAKEGVVRQFQRRFFTHLLRTTGGNVAAAADLADLHRAAFHRLLTELGIDPDTFRN
jgi:two-component system nitrogen regulation response regulator NtrX